MVGVTLFLIVAVEQYRSKPFTRVRWAQKDAEDLVVAWQALGYHPDDFTVLLNDAATKTAVEYHLKKIAGRVQKGDRIIIFFAGHGFSVHGDNLIAPVDAQYDALEDTCVSINTVLGYLKKSGSERNLLFLDCCHSGFEPGEEIRDVKEDFLIDDLAYALKDEVYCIGFASCRSHQISNSHPAVQHGVWSHFLINALSGNGGDIYEENLLLSDNLQSYLRIHTADFVKKHTDDKRDQTPMVFGSFSDRFVVEDLTAIFEKREAERKAAAFKMTSIVLYDTEDGKVRDLPEFRRGHRVPDRLGSAQDSFIKTASGDLISDEIDTLSEQIKDTMGYSIKDFTAEKSNGFASITTPDFSYSVEISQSDDDPKKYVIKRTLDGVYNDQIVNDKQFNELFDSHFRNLSFEFDKKINIPDFIARVEKTAKQQGISLTYAPANPRNVRIIFPGSVNEIVVDGHTINISLPQAQSPAGLIEAYKETTLQLEGAKMNLLETT